MCVCACVWRVFPCGSALSAPSAPLGPLAPVGPVGAVRAVRGFSRCLEAPRAPQITTTPPQVPWWCLVVRVCVRVVCFRAGRLCRPRRRRWARRRRRPRWRRSRRSRLFALFRSPQSTPNHHNPTPGPLVVSGGRVCVRVVCFRAGRLCRPRRRRWARRRRRRRWRRWRRSRLFAFFKSPQSTKPLPQAPWWVLVVSGGGCGFV